MVSLSAFLVTWSQLWLRNTQWKLPEVKSSQVLNCILFWVVRWDLTLSQLFHSVSHGTWLTSSVFTLSTPPALVTCIEFGAVHNCRHSWKSWTDPPWVRGIYFIDSISWFPTFKGEDISISTHSSVSYHSISNNLSPIPSLLSRLRFIFCSGTQN